MSTFSLSGTGTHALSTNVTALRITITTLPAGLTSGRANPTNHFDIGMIRFGDGTAFWAPVPIVGGPHWIGVPVGSTQIGYAILNDAVVSVVEVIGGKSPFAGSNSPLDNAQTTLTSNVSMPSANSWLDALSLTLDSGIWLIVANIEIVNSAGAAANAKARITDGSTIYAENQTFFSSSAGVSVPITCIASLVAATTIKLQGSASSAGSTIWANVGGNSWTRLIALRVG